ncbi:MAG TPA: hypothetical protein VGH28_08185 [Polyangiaceae bacterium]
MNHRGRSLAALGFLLFWACSARAQTPELDQARATFSEALADEEAGRDDVALEKFQRVAAVRDTAQVEYRIATCLEALGRRRAALHAYDRASRLGRADAQNADVASAASARAAALGVEMGTLAIVVRGGDAPDVRVDGEAIAPTELDAVVLDPGDHVVDVSAPHDKPAHANVTIARGAKLRLTVDLVREAVPPSLTPEPMTPSYKRRNVGIVAIAVGAAFAASAGIALFVRNDLIDSIHTICPNDVCPAASHDDVESKRALANQLAPVAAIFGAIALVPVVVGIVLVALGPQRVLLGAAPLAGGGAFFVRGAF